MTEIKYRKMPHKVYVEGHIFQSVHFSHIKDGVVVSEHPFVKFCFERFGDDELMEAPPIESFRPGVWKHYMDGSKGWCFAFEKAGDAMLFKLTFNSKRKKASRRK